MKRPAGRAQAVAGPASRLRALLRCQFPGCRIGASRRLKTQGSGPQAAPGIGRSCRRRCGYHLTASEATIICA